MQVGGQQLGGDPVEPPLDSALLAALEERGGLQLDWQGTTFLVGSRQGRWDGALLWQQGTAKLTVTGYRSIRCLKLMSSLHPRQGRLSWQLELQLTGQYCTPWPDKVAVTGGQWTNPAGINITVPAVQTTTTIPGRPGMLPL